MARSRPLVALVVLLIAATVAACGGTSPSASLGPSLAVVATPSLTPSPSPSATPSPSPTPAPTITPSPTPTPAPTVEPAVIRLPTGWQNFSLDPDTMASQMDALAASNPQISTWLKTAVNAGMLKMITNFALRYHGARVSGDVVVVRLGALGGMDITEFKSSMESQFRAMGATAVKSKKVELPAGTAIQFDFGYQFHVPTGSLSVHDRAWMLMADGVAYEIGVTCLNDVPACLADGSAIATSFRPAPGDQTEVP